MEKACCTEHEKTKREKKKKNCEEGEKLHVLIRKNRNGGCIMPLRHILFVGGCGERKNEKKFEKKKPVKTRPARTRIIYAGDTEMPHN